MERGYPGFNIVGLNYIFSICVRLFAEKQQLGLINELQGGMIKAVFFIVTQEQNGTPPKEIIFYEQQ